MTPKRNLGRQPGTKILEHEEDRQVQFSSRLPLWLKALMTRCPVQNTTILKEAVETWMRKNGEDVDGFKEEFRCTLSEEEQGES